MTDQDRHHHAEERFRALLVQAGLPEPDEGAHLRRCVIFLWESSKSVVLIDLDELPPGEDPFAGFDPWLLVSEPLDDQLGDGFAATG